MVNTPLVYGTEYNIWRNGLYIGKAFWVEDKNIGDCFLQKIAMTGDDEINIVCEADQWTLATDEDITQMSDN